MQQALNAAVAQVCPIDGVSIGRRDDKATWRIDFRPAANDQQKAAALAVVEAFDPDAALKAELKARVVAERDRRLALGFNYDFQDARGVHRIGTKKSDLDGWSEVSTYAGALIDSGDVTTTIAIVTDTGPCLVTAPEWRAIELKAAEFRQPLWAKSFALMASNPIPASFADDSHWS